MDVEAFDEEDFYRALAASGARILLIGRRAVIAWGVPVSTADYDLWIPATDAATLNRAVQPFDMFPNRSPEQARSVGRYVLENGERVDVLVARSVPTVDGVRVDFEEVWQRREELVVARGATIAVPCIDDLILTKRFAARPKDAEDIRLLRALQESRR
ncbi:MAG: hypothetical protein U0234_24860 [Sandaracinus sp.]